MYRLRRRAEGRSARATQAALRTSWAISDSSPGSDRRARAPVRFVRPPGAPGLGVGAGGYRRASPLRPVESRVLPFDAGQRLRKWPGNRSAAELEQERLSRVAGSDDLSLRGERSPLR